MTLSVTGLPSGASASWSTNPVTGSGTSRLTVRTSLTTPRATSKLTTTGTSGALEHQISVTLTVT